MYGLDRRIVTCSRTNLANMLFYKKMDYINRSEEGQQPEEGKLFSTTKKSKLKNTPVPLNHPNQVPLEKARRLGP